LVVSGVPFRVKKIRWSGSSEEILDSRARRTSAAKEGTDTVLVDVAVFGCGCRWVGFPVGETIVPHSRTVAGVVVALTSLRRMASTSPMRAEVPSMTSMMSSSCPSGGGPGRPCSRRQPRTARRILSICSTVSDSACPGGLRRRAVSRTGFARMASYRTAIPNARLKTVRACFAML
jgi:hypothetical protein